jgi:hypothetical protein
MENFKEPSNAGEIPGKLYLETFSFTTELLFSSLKIPVHQILSFLYNLGEFKLNIKSTRFINFIILFRDLHEEGIPCAFPGSRK